MRDVLFLGVNQQGRVMEAVMNVWEKVKWWTFFVIFVGQIELQWELQLPIYVFR